MTNYTIDGNKISFVSFDSYKIKKNNNERERQREKKNIYTQNYFSTTIANDNNHSFIYSFG